MRHFAFLSFLLVLALNRSIAAMGQDEICSRYTSVPLPAEAQVVAQPYESPDCASYKSYEGIGRKTDYVAARECAWKERAAQAAQLPQNPKSILSWVVGGSLILSDLYANGRGTPTNIPLAIRLACENKGAFVSDALTELASRVDHPQAAKPFELCDYAANTFEMNFCAAYGNEAADAARDREATEQMRMWPAEHKAKFLAAKKAFDAYVEAVERDETYMGGTIHTMRALWAANALQEDFSTALRRYESGKLPQMSTAAYLAHDAELNRVFQEALRSAQSTVASDGFTPGEEIQPDGIRKTERAWLTYRDAWVAFATQHYRGTTREAWSDELTQSRLHRLLLLACDGKLQETLCTAAIHKEIESQN